MDIRKPKPIHNWREFLKEVGTIVLGVSIALAAEQGAEWWHWRNQVTEAKAVIASEMARNISFGIERLRMARCAQARLNAIETILDNAAQKGALPPLGSVGTAPGRPWSTGAWDSVVASQAATHFPRQQLAALSLIYKQVARVEIWSRQELDVWSTLRTMAGAGRRFDPSYETELRKAMGLAALYNNIIAATSRRLIESAKAQNLPFTVEERHLIASAMKTPDFTYLCQPVSTIATQGGINASETTFSLNDDTLKHMSDITAH